MESNQFTPNKASEEQQNQPKASSSKAVSALLVLLAIGVIVVVASSVMKNKDVVVNRNVVNGNIVLENANATTNTNQPAVIDNTNQQTEVITSNVDTSNWKVYKNDECKIQTKYPLDWEVAEEVVKSDITNEMVTRLSVSPIKKRTYQSPDGGTDEIPGVTINCYPKDSIDKVSRSLGFGVMGTIKKVEVGNNTMTLRDGQPEFNPPYGDDRLLEALIDGDKTLLISSWGYDTDVFFGVLKTLVLTVDISEWKTYKNEKLGVEFMYPNTWPEPEQRLDIPKATSWTLNVGAIAKGFCEGSDCYVHQMSGKRGASPEFELQRVTNEYGKVIKDYTREDGTRVIQYTVGGICGELSGLVFGSDRTIEFSSRCGMDSPSEYNLHSAILANLKLIDQK